MKGRLVCQKIKRRAIRKGLSRNTARSRLIVLGALVLGAGCVSPQVVVHKNVTITVNGERCPKEECGSFLPVWIHVEYTTEAELDTKLKVEQDIKPETTIPLPGL